MSILTRGDRELFQCYLERHPAWDPGDPDGSAMSEAVRRLLDLDHAVVVRSEQTRPVALIVRRAGRHGELRASGGRRELCRKALVDFIATAKPVLCAYCNQRLATDGLCASCLYPAPRVEVENNLFPKKTK